MDDTPPPGGSGAGRRPASVLDLGLELDPPDPRTDPDAATSPDAVALRDDAPPIVHTPAPGGGDSETELDLRLPDMTLMPMAKVRAPPRTALGADDAPPLELARPVGRARGSEAPPPMSSRARPTGGTRELEDHDTDPVDSATPELARELRRGTALPPPRRPDRALRWLVVVLVLAGGVTAAILLGVSPRGLVEQARARLPASLPALPAGIPGLPTGDMVTLEAATFARGCVGDDPDCNADERPPEILSMPALSVDRTEVTAAEYDACVATGACTAAGERDPLCTGGKGDASKGLPINCVDAGQAAAFCRVHGKRLPTAVEWEFAARGGQPIVHPWGATKPSCALANIGGCGGKAQPVGSKPAGATAQGLLDVAGNVWEWTADGTPERREIRGGSYLDGARTVRASNRGWADARTQIAELGFRCVK